MFFSSRQKLTILAVLTVFLFSALLLVFGIDSVRNMKVREKNIQREIFASEKLKNEEDIDIQTEETINASSTGKYSNPFPSPLSASAVKLLFFGDLMLDRHVGERISAKGGDIGYFFDGLLGVEKDFFNGYDIVGCNLEGAVTDAGRHYAPQKAYDFAFAPDVVNKMKAYRFNFFNLANNHFLDQGRQGVTETRKNLSFLDFTFSGCPDGEIGECSTIIKEIDGKNFAFSGFSLTGGYWKWEELENEMKSAALASDFAIVNIHWGVEYDHKQNIKQTEIAHRLIDSGADLIIGHHPHVIQGVEIYKDKPIFYSLGNFMFDQTFSRDTQMGIALDVAINEQKNEIHILPFKSEKLALSWLDEVERDQLFLDIISWSDLDLNRTSALERGVVNF